MSKLVPFDRMRRVTVAVVGGGITGIAAALKLAEKGGFDVTLFEKQDRLGGLDSSYSWDGLVCDRFYHVVLPTDSHSLRLLDALGLGGSVYWRRVKSGFYGDRRLVSLSSVRDFARFPFLTFPQKVRLGLGILSSVRRKNISRLDGVPASRWLEHLFGRNIYARLWEPLLRSKLGEATDRTSAAFIWATIRRLYGARRSRSKQEKMGYWRNGYAALLEAAEKRLRAHGATIRTRESVLEIRAVGRGGLPPAGEDPGVEIATGLGPERFGRVLLTVPCPEAVRLTGAGTHPYWRRLGAVEYLGMICVLLVLKRPVSPYYVINLLDGAFPFTGVVETTNVIPPVDLGARHLLYLPKYVTSGDPLNDLPDSALADLFVGRLREIFPDIGDADILHRRVFREPFAQPIPALRSLANPILSRTPVPHVFLANTAMIPDTLHNNDANIKLAGEVAESIPGPS